jgi:hypothetical protein
MPKIYSLPDDTRLGYEANASGGIRTSETAGETFTIEARDIDGASWTPFITITAGNTPTCVSAER